MKTLQQVLTEYRQNHHALPAFNIDTFEIFQAVELAVAATGLPCLVQLSAGEDKFIKAERLFILAKKAQADGLPIYLNMDHGQDLNRLEFLVHLGFDMVHFDGSSLDYVDNLRQTTDFVTRIKKVNPQIVVEAEFNKINLVEKGISSESYTDPQKAVEFISTSHADLLAVSLGNLHGVNSIVPEHLDLELFSKIAQALPQIFFTLHGGSGISSDQIAAAINLGVVKININTDLRLKFKQSLSLSLASLNTEKLYQYLAPVITDVSEVIQQKLIQFSSSHV